MGEDEQPEDAKFNMALDTLRRIGAIFEHIKNLYLDRTMSDEIRQKIKIELVKQFFIQASPLLPIPTVAKYRQEILEIEPKRTKTYQKNGGGSTDYIGDSLSYNSNLDFKLDMIVIELQQILQEKKYFMPPAEDDEGL